MKQLIGSSQILAFCKSYLSKENYSKVLNKINNSKIWGDDFFIELIRGGLLGYLGLNVKYEHKLLNKTPDWIILDKENENILSIVEVTQLHIDYETDKKTSRKNKTETHIISYWMDEELAKMGRNNSERLYEKLVEKALTYKKTIKQSEIGYIIAVYIHGKLYFNDDEIKPLLYGEMGLFQEHPYINGIITLMELGNCEFKFQFCKNSKKNELDTVPNDIVINMRTKNDNKTGKY
jgi:hypothetical protein